jgi:hypothetical protein
MPRPRLDVPFVGAWNLEMCRGGPLPCNTLPPQGKEEIMSGSLNVDSAGTVRLAFEKRATDLAGVVTTSIETDDGTYSWRNRSRNLTFVFSDGTSLVAIFPVSETLQSKCGELTLIWARRTDP